MGKRFKMRVQYCHRCFVVSEKVISCRHMGTTSYNMAYIFNVGSTQSEFIIAIGFFPLSQALLFLRCLVDNSWS